jgi:hypothetical protein
MLDSQKLREIGSSANGNNDFAEVDCGLDPAGYLVDTRSLSIFLGCSARSLQQLATDGKLPKHSQNLWNLKDCIDAHRKHSVAVAVSRFKDEGGENDEATAAMRAEKLQKLAAEREMAQIKLLGIKNETHAAADVRAIFGEMVVTIRSRLQALPHGVAPSLQGLDSVPEIIEVLNKAINQVLLELSDYDAAEFSARSKDVKVIDQDAQAEKEAASKEQLDQFNEIYADAVEQEESK